MGKMILIIDTQQCSPSLLIQLGKEALKYLQISLACSLYLPDFYSLPYKPTLILSAGDRMRCSENTLSDPPGSHVPLLRFYVALSSSLLKLISLS